MLATVDKTVFDDNGPAITALAAAAPLAIAAPVDGQTIAATGAQPLTGEIPEVAASLTEQQQPR